MTLRDDLLPIDRPCRGQFSSKLVDSWVRDENPTGIRAEHDPDILMFDVPPPFLSRGLDAYVPAWQRLLGVVENQRNC